ncbi:MAG: hypothetical protein ACFCBU_13870 [Cyanophyceae cyanobacterium]
MPFSFSTFSLPKQFSLRRSPQGRSPESTDIRANPQFAKLQEDGIYPCPVCRHGTVATMPLMDAFSCDFCRHIFSADFEEQVLRVEDSAQPLRWQWRSNKTWRPARYTKAAATPTFWTTAVAIAVIPPALVGTSQYLFPPLSGTKSAIPVPPHLWLGLTVLIHGAIASWLLLEHHQWSAYVSLKVQGQDWVEKLLGWRP